MLSKIASALIVLNCLSTIQAAKRPFHLKLSSITCKAISAPVQRLNCILSKLDESHYALNGYIEFSRDLARNAEVQLQLHFKTARGSKVVKLFDFQLNLCDLLEHSHQVPLIRQIVNESFRASNLPYYCPFKGNLLFNVTNFIVSDDYLPKYMPSIFFNFTLKYYENKKVFATLLLQGSTIMRS